MRSQWFVIHTLSGQEQKVKDSIEKRIKSEEMAEFIKEVLVPMEKVAEVRMCSLTWCCWTITSA